MTIIGFFIFFVVIGWIIALATLGDSSRGGIIILALTIFWAFVSGPWAIATWIELMIGFSLASSKHGWTYR